MIELDVAQIVNSAIASLVIALLFLGSAPFWWKKIKPLLVAERLREKVMPLIPVVVLGLAIWAISSPSSQPPLKLKPANPNMTEQEIHSILNKCEMKAIEVATQLQGTTVSAQMERDSKQARYYKLCLSENGIELVPDTGQEDEPDSPSPADPGSSSPEEEEY